MRPIWEAAAEADQRLRADDPRLNGLVVLQHGDGSHFVWDSAFYVRARSPGVPPEPQPPDESGDGEADDAAWAEHYRLDDLDRNENRWIVVFTEHHGFHVYGEGDVERIRYYRGIGNDADVGALEVAELGGGRS